MRSIFIAIATVVVIGLIWSNRLVVEVQENLGVLTVDPMRLRQILLNVLSNACKFTMEGEVKLQARRVADGRDWIELSVSDAFSIQYAEIAPSADSRLEHAGHRAVLDRPALIRSTPDACAIRAGRRTLVDCCASTTLSHFSRGTGRTPEFGLGRKEIWACSRPRGNRNGRTLLLLSCGAAFITGIVIAATSLFGG